MKQPADCINVAGIRHAHGENANLPREMACGNMADIRDPVGAVAALFEPGTR